MGEFIDDIQDYEYGVQFDSILVKCSGCGLVRHEPPVTNDQIPALYPASYLAHSKTSSSRSVYGALKRVLAASALRRISRMIEAGGTFVEVGCGNCSFSSMLADLRPDIAIVGVDIEEVKPPAGLKNFTFVKGQFEECEITARSADVIYFSNLIEHVADPRHFLQACNRALRRGGWIVGVTPDHLSVDRFIFRKYWAGYHYPRHTHVFNHVNLGLLIESSGFEDVTIKGSYSFWYLSLANRFVRLPGTKKRGLLFALVTAIMLPFDVLVNTLRTHGSLSFRARLKYPGVDS